MIVLGTFSPVAAQLSEEAWSEPVNLSRSGAATNPIMVVDSDGIFHVIWQDTFSGYVYTRGDGVEWSEPVPVSLPFGKFVPQLFADGDGYIHALWLSDKSYLYYSRVIASNFSSAASWSQRQRLTESAVAMDVARDATGQMHLSYVRPLETADYPAGVYYQRLRARTDNWSIPKLLYESPYFRSLTVENAHIQVDTASQPEVEQVYVVWDDRPRERIYFIRSGDGGENWDLPVEIDIPEEGRASSGPANILVSATGSNVFLLWQSDHSASSCVQYFQNSVDGGLTWQERQRKPDDFLDCPARSKLLEMGENGILQFSVVKDQVFLQAWDGSRWSDPQIQEILSSFTDPDTNRLVTFSCQQPVLLGSENLYVVGCDTGSGQDIWWLKRQLIDVTDWFPKEVVWRSLTNLASGEVNYLSPVIVVQPGGPTHALWSQAVDPVAGGMGRSIYYSRWEGRQWSQPIPILSSPVGKTEQPEAALSPTGRLYVAWSGGQSGEIYLSSADAGRAMLTSAWAKPLMLPAPQQAGSNPDILIDPQGVISIVYSIPLNEGRGIYLTRSADEGQTWSDPVKIFDGVAAGWAMVDQPKITRTGNGSMHVIWTRYSLPSGTGSLGLYYARSDDNGLSWSVPETVVDNPVVWSQIIGIQDQTVHRVWQEFSSGRTTLWHEKSLDNGGTWSRIAPVSIFGDTIGSPSLTWDIAGQLHLLQVVSRSAQDFVLQHWLFDGQSWITERNLDLRLDPGASIGSLASGTSPEGGLAVLFSGTTVNKDSGKMQYHLYYTDRTFELPAELPAVQTGAAPVPVVEPTPTPQPSPTPTVEAALATPTIVTALPQEPVNTSNSWVGSILVPVGAGLIVLVAVLIGVRIRRP